MREAWRIFKSDLKHLFNSNVVTAITAIGLVLLPSLFSWYNILACWDVFDNTGKLTVAVANTDEGYTSDLIPLRVNIGDQVVGALRSNDPVDWVVVDQEEAIDGTKAGRYYAAVVIPKTFSRDMMSFFSEDIEHATIIYYTNEKKNAVAPKITDQSANQIAAQVNEAFSEAVGETALALASSLYDYASDNGLDGRIAVLNQRLATTSVQMRDASNLLLLYADLMDASADMARDAGGMLLATSDSAGELANQMSDVQTASRHIDEAVNEATDALSAALAANAADYDDVLESIDAAFDAAADASGDAAAALRHRADELDAGIADMEALITRMETLREALPQEQQTHMDALIQRMRDVVDLQERARDALLDSADSIESKTDDLGDKRVEAKEAAQLAQQGILDVKAAYEQDLKPALDELTAKLAQMGEAVAAASRSLENAAYDLAGRGDSAANRLDASAQDLREVAAALSEAADKLSQLTGRLDEAIASNDLEAFRKAIGADPSALARALAAPVGIDRHAIYPVENFGSAMTPLYATLALWIGALLIMVTIKAVPSPRHLEELGDPKPRQVFIGRWGIVGLFSLMQSTVMALGNLLFLGVQAVHPLLFLLCFWVAGLVFSFIIYTMVALFANLGKALGVVLLIVQVSGGGGSFPLKLLPHAFQAVSPYLPIAHAVNAMRAAMFGLYQGDFWIEIATLLAFALPFVLLGVVLHGPLNRVVPRFIARIEKSGIM
ncbi:MAG: YhgE/Pip domain-containing protein [Coriobacteriales bacterium]|nr:YhgE/Pip domain-containing protein [Coriobacteriales bacterium]